MRVTYQCEICGSNHDNAVDAATCEAKPIRDFGYREHQADWHVPEVGDVVECAYPATSWWDGDESWRVYREYGGRFLDGFYALWVVVAKIPDGGAHKWKYILWSPSNVTGKPWMCWTGPDHTRVRPNRKATAAEKYVAQAMYEEYASPHHVPLL